MSILQPKGTKHTPKTRRTLSGKVLPNTQDRAPSFLDLVFPGPKAKAKEVPAIDAPDLGPTQSHVVLTDHAHAPRNAPRRRDRRAAERAL